MDRSMPASLSITNSQSIPKLMSVLVSSSIYEDTCRGEPRLISSFSITSSSNTLEGHQRHWNLFIDYVNGYLLWWSPESWKLLPSATLQTSCVLDQCSEKAMAPHSSTLAWKIPWMEEPGGLQSMGSLGVGHDWMTSLSLFTFMHWRRKWQPSPVFLPGESQGQGSLVGCHLWGRTESDTTEVT